jgi:predicted O-methyltransferase YrrM
MGVYFNPSNILEMGTSFGITSSYLAMSMPHQTLVTMEGAPAIAQVAQGTFDLLQLKNIQIMEGDFATSLPVYLNSISNIGMVYIDGNHRYAPTMEYFKLLLSKVNEQSILIFDDIYWSSEMEQAWDEIKKHEAVTLTIDLFYIGIVFFRKESKQKQHFTIRY